jgi:putative hydrolase of HD superfamily
MRRKVEKPSLPIEKDSPASFTRFYFELVRLKHLYRQGWLQRGIPESQCESVAEHSYGVSCLAMLLADLYFPQLNMEKVLRLSLLHDLGEIDAGDITPSDGVSIEKKSKMERESLFRIFQDFPIREQYLQIWEEYEEGKTAESVFVRQVEKLEMAFQAKVYEAITQTDLSQFLESVSKILETQQLKEILEEIT